jgi:hypothetical protein
MALAAANQPLDEVHTRFMPMAAQHSDATRRHGRELGVRSAATFEPSLLAQWAALQQETHGAAAGGTADTSAGSGGGSGGATPIVLLPGTLRPFDKEMATWHSRVTSPTFSLGASPGEPMNVTLAGSTAEVLDEPSATEMREALRPALRRAALYSASEPDDAAAAGEGARPESPHDLPDALRTAGAGSANPWHGTIRHCSAADLATCLGTFGSRLDSPHLTLDVFAQIRLRCLHKRQHEMVEAGLPQRVRAALRTHANAAAVQNLGHEVLALLTRNHKPAGAQQTHGYGAATSVGMGKPHGLPSAVIGACPSGLAR